jgi:hypothetical protein
MRDWLGAIIVISMGLHAACGGEVGSSDSNNAADGGSGGGGGTGGRLVIGSGGRSLGVGGLANTGGLVASGGTVGAGAFCGMDATATACPQQNCTATSDECTLATSWAALLDATNRCAMTPPPNGCLSAAFLQDPTLPEGLQCMHDCLTSVAPAAPVTPACSPCLVAVTTCSAQYCINDCIADPGSLACQICNCRPQNDAAGVPIGNCMQDAFAKCAGFRPSESFVGCGGSTGMPGCSG